LQWNRRNQCVIIVKSLRFPFSCESARYRCEIAV
jgi:hypothetical protein